MKHQALHTLVDLCPDGIVFINEQGKVDYANRAFFEISGFSADQVLNQDEAIMARRILELCDASQAGQCDISKIQDIEIMRWHSPISKSVSCTRRQLDDEQGRTLGHVLYFHDIAHEADINRQEKSDFLSAAAHKLRTPLVGILGFSELLLKRDFDQAQQADVISTINRQANDFKLLLDDFLDIERIDARKGNDFRIVTTTLEAMFDDLAADALSKSETVKTVYLKPQHWPLVACDLDKIRQVMDNLVSNAVKYSADGSTVKCDTMLRNNGDIEEFGLVVADQGAGMTPEELERVGERFYQVDNSQSASGSGLGIALAREILHIHNGRLELKSIKNRGTTATAWLPVCKN